MRKWVEKKAGPPDSFMYEGQTLTEPLCMAASVFANSVRFPSHDERNILAAEAERVRHSGSDPRVPCLLRHDVKRDGRIRNIVADGGWNALVFQRQKGEHRFYDAGGGARVSDHRLLGRAGNLSGIIVKDSAAAE